MPAEDVRETRVVEHVLDEPDSDDASVIRLVNQFIEEAIRDRTTDIHFELYRGEVTCTSTY